MNSNIPAPTSATPASLITTTSIEPVKSLPSVNNEATPACTKNKSMNNNAQDHNNQLIKLDEIGSDHSNLFDNLDLNNFSNDGKDILSHLARDIQDSSFDIQ
ncbi:hypothetical protein SSS_10139 [Sarcoptes scabiei]|uniref:Uncharacterized protein n=1 Tax=Sarcoptes scabiei TaxID=52283 RepID=A0A834RBE3_SARSC|nr:hypothetical protein SSS_10139 [Sarcoptes scabiei]